MDLYVIYGSLGLLVIAISVITYIVIEKNKSIPKKIINLPMILPLFDKGNINKVEYIRNKIVVTFKDVTLFDIEGLHSSGIAGINIIGDKVKFYLDDTNESNENLYNAIKDTVEGK